MAFPQANLRTQFGINRIPPASARLTLGENVQYEALVLLSFTAAEPTFLAAGFIVVNASELPTKRHGRLRCHRANLVRKRHIVPLSPSRSRTQLYLLGCVCEGKSYCVSWLEEIFALGMQIDLPGREASREASSRAVRPTQRETPQSLMDKGFMPSRPRSAQNVLRLITPKLTSWG
jgi:hypothetical protein